MSYPVREPFEGKLVYAAYSPQKAGKIIEVVHPVGSPRRKPDGTTYPRFFATVRVRWLNGEEAETETSGLQDFQALISDHEKKLATHRATLARLQQMA